MWYLTHLTQSRSIGSCEEKNNKTKTKKLKHRSKAQKAICFWGYVILRGEKKRGKTKRSGTGGTSCLLTARRRRVFRGVRRPTPRDRHWRPDSLSPNHGVLRCARVATQLFPPLSRAKRTRSRQPPQPFPAHIGTARKTSTDHWLYLLCGVRLSEVDLWFIVCASALKYSGSDILRGWFIWLVVMTFRGKVWPEGAFLCLKKSLLFIRALVIRELLTGLFWKVNKFVSKNLMPQGSGL